MKLSLKVILMATIKLAIALMMVCLGIETSRDARLLVGSLVAAFVVIPLAAYGLFQIMPLPFGTIAGLFAVSLKPDASMLYLAPIKRGVGNPELAASFQVTVTLLKRIDTTARNHMIILPDIMSL